MSLYQYYCSTDIVLLLSYTINAMNHCLKLTVCCRNDDVYPPQGSQGRGAPPGD